MDKYVSFKDFENIKRVLENNTIFEIKRNVKILEAHKLDPSFIPQIEAVNEGIIDNLKNKFQGMFGGTDIGQADKIIAEYTKANMDALSKIDKIMMAAFKGKVKAGADAEGEAAEKKPVPSQKDKNGNPVKDATAYDLLSSQMDERSRTAIDTIKKASANRIKAIQEQINAFIEGKNKRVTTYVLMKVADAKRQLAEAELSAAEKFASDDVIKQLEEVVKTRNVEVKAKGDELTKMQAEEKKNPDAAGSDKEGDPKTKGDAAVEGEPKKVTDEEGDKNRKEMHVDKKEKPAEDFVPGKDEKGKDQEAAIPSKASDFKAGDAYVSTNKNGVEHDVTINDKQEDHDGNKVVDGKVSVKYSDGDTWAVDISSLAKPKKKAA